MLPCAVGLLYPGLIVLLLGARRRVGALTAFAVVAAVAAWMRASDLEGRPATWLLVLLALIGGGLLTQSPKGWLHALGGGGLIGVVAGATWMPCVGNELASILNNAPTRPLEELLPMLVYVFGVTSILFVVALIPIVFEPIGRGLDHEAVTLIGGGLAVALVIALAGGVYNDLLSEFAQLSVR